MTDNISANAEKVAGAISPETVEWHAIDWQKAHRNVRRLQARIVKAVQEGRWGKVKALQRLLTHSFSAKALAVKRVTENKGKRTPGVDGEIWQEQNGICPLCNQKITKLTGWHNHHIVWRVNGGSDKAENRVLLHPNCHRQVHSQMLEVAKPRPSSGVRKA